MVLDFQKVELDIQAFQRSHPYLADKIKKTNPGKFLPVRPE
jgi:hypothetical protein